MTPEADRRPPVARGFTLVEILVVIVIILMISAVVLPLVQSALSGRQVSEAARILQAALVGARDQAIHNGRPSGIRLLPDPAYPIVRTSSGTIDPRMILAYNRWVPLECAPEYAEGRCTPIPPAFVAVSNGWPCAITNQVTYSWAHGPLPHLVLVESPANPGTGEPNAPTSWFWNIRVGDKVQLGGSGPFYTVVGPMVIPPSGTTVNGNFYSNTEMFVNAGPVGPLSTLPVPTINGQPVEYLTLVNGRDDDANGWVDEEFDGVDNDGNGSIDDLSEWELETWKGSLKSLRLVDMPYRILRGPAPGANSREIALPTPVVIDATTALLTQERSRLPINRYTGYADIVLNGDGTVMPTAVYSTPSSFGMADAFFHFWLAERVDLAAAPAGGTGAASTPLLPVGPSAGADRVPYPGARLQGSYALLTLFTRTGQIVPNEAMPFDDPTLASAANRPFNVNVPFMASQEGAAGS
jgi:prepilin-type N-terminal cleavage/methylation domain-containing protein